MVFALSFLVDGAGHAPVIIKHGEQSCPMCSEYIHGNIIAAVPDLHYFPKSKFF